ncbi:MAG: plasmid mobilization relaxosome protein MobC [Ruminococcaceae bacterium]|nr:plasmid mobilization relaxosome protein MobC [Oscillospiraceae bacterium]
MLIRALILGKRLVEAPPVDYKQFIIELRRVGTNLNQLTAKANAIGFIDRSE